MKMRYRIIFAAAGAMMLLAGCAKEIGGGTDSPLNFSASIPEIVATKADPVISLSAFRVKGFTGSSQWFPTTGDPFNVTLSGGTATYSNYIWRGDKKTFYAYTNNVPGGASASIESTGVTLTYTSLPTEASAQTDVLLGRYEGNGNGTGTASMTFYHPLAQVVFNVGTIDASLTAISKIEIVGVYSAGSTTLSTSITTASGTPAVANFSWTGTGGSATVSQTVTGSLPASGQIGVPFMLIPQTLTSKSVTVKVYATVDGVAKTLTTTLNSGSFATGKTTIYSINYSTAKGLNFSAPTVITWEESNLDDYIFREDDSNGSGSYIFYYRGKGKVLPTIDRFATSGSFDSETGYGYFQRWSGGYFYSIPENAFNGSENSFIEVFVPYRVTTIGKWAFKDHKYLRYINIPKDVTSVHNLAFEGVEGNNGGFFIETAKGFFDCTNSADCTIILANGTTVHLKTN